MWVKRGVLKARFCLRALTAERTKADRSRVIGLDFVVGLDYTRKPVYGDGFVDKSSACKFVIQRDFKTEIAVAGPRCKSRGLGAEKRVCAYRS